MNTKLSKILVTAALLAGGLANAAWADSGTNYTTPGGGTLVAILNWLFGL